MIQKETGIAFLALAILVAAIWYKSKARVSLFALRSAGQIVPEPAVSNSPADDGHAWTTPYYLRANYPASRPGMGIMPSIVNTYIPDSFGMQDLGPQF